MRALIFLLALTAVILAAIPQNASITPYPKTGANSSVLCGYIADANLKVTATISYENSTQINKTNTTSILANTTGSVFSTDFATVPAGSKIVLNCLLNDSDTSMLFSETYTVLGTGTDFGSQPQDSFIAMVAFSLLGIAFIFAYLFTKAGELWADVWMFMCSLMLLSTIFALYIFSNNEQADALTGIIWILFTCAAPMLSLLLLHMLYKLWIIVITFITKAVKNE